MNDLEKIQVATSHILADLLRQSFTVLALGTIVLQDRLEIGRRQPYSAPVCAGADAQAGRRIRGTTRRAQDDTAELNQVLQETLSGHQVVKSFGAEEIESNRFSGTAPSACAAVNLR
jgi:subfamily B ATP-binding cassette protein MsbA